MLMGWSLLWLETAVVQPFDAYVQVLEDAID